MVYILSKDNKPLMPTSRYGHVRKLLQANKAKVIKRTPFTIQLLYNSKTYTQPISLGIMNLITVIGYRIMIIVAIGVALIG